MELLELLHKDKSGNQYGLFKCSCSKTRISRLSDVKAKRVTKCKASGKLKQSENGSRQGKASIKHGDSGTPLYNRWVAMKSRAKNHQAYVARNITVCKKWLDSFNNFKEDMQDTFFEHAVLDRIDNSKSYSKDNCQWLTVSNHSIKTAKDIKNANYV